MKQIVIKKSENCIETELDINLVMVTFEGLTNYREEHKTVEALFYGITNEDVLVPFHIPLQLIEDEDINDFSGIFIHKPMISSRCQDYIVSRLIKKTDEGYFLQLSLSNEEDKLFIVKIDMASSYIISYTLDCIYNHNMIDIKSVSSLYRIYREEYKIHRLSYTSFNDISIDKAHISKDGSLYVLLSFYTTNEDKSVEATHCLFIAGLDKKQTRALLKKAKSSIKFTDFESFKELSTVTEDKFPVYLLEEPITFNYETKKGNTLSKYVFVQHHYNTSVVFLEAEFNKFLSDLTEIITTL